MSINRKFYDSWQFEEFESNIASYGAVFYPMQIYQKLIDLETPYVLDRFKLCYKLFLAGHFDSIMEKINYGEELIANLANNGKHHHIIARLFEYRGFYNSRKYGGCYTFLEQKEDPVADIISRYQNMCHSHNYKCSHNFKIVQNAACDFIVNHNYGYHIYSVTAQDIEPILILATMDNAILGTEGSNIGECKTDTISTLVKRAIDNNDKESLKILAKWASGCIGTELITMAALTCRLDKFDEIMNMFNRNPIAVNNVTTNFILIYDEKFPYNSLSAEMYKSLLIRKKRADVEEVDNNRGGCYKTIKMFNKNNLSIFANILIEHMPTE